jgi:alpha-methylacyl-CoA racemase
LADFGADVVRVDRNDRPDPYGTLSLAHGKRSVELDLKDTDDAEQLRELADNADVLIEPYRPGVMERLGLGPDELRARNPRLVYARLTV